MRVLDERLIPIEQELRPIARADPRVALLITIPGIGDLLGLTIASEIGRRHLAVRIGAQARRVLGADATDLPVRRKVTHRQAVELRLDDVALGRDRSRAAGVAPDQLLAPALRRRQDALRRQGQPRVARKVLIAAWHVLALEQPFTPSRPRDATAPVPANSSCVLAD